MNILTVATVALDAFLNLASPEAEHPRSDDTKTAPEVIISLGKATGEGGMSHRKFGGRSPSFFDDLRSRFGLVAERADTQPPRAQKISFTGPPTLEEEGEAESDQKRTRGRRTRLRDESEQDTKGSGVMGPMKLVGSPPGPEGFAGKRGGGESGRGRASGGEEIQEAESMGVSEALFEEGAPDPGESLPSRSNVSAQLPRSPAGGSATSTLGTTPPTTTEPTMPPASVPIPGAHSQDGGTPVSDHGGGASVESAARLNPQHRLDSDAQEDTFEDEHIEEKSRQVYEAAGEKSPNEAEQSPHSTAEGHTSSNTGATPPAARGSEQSSAPEPNPGAHSQDGGTPVSDLGGEASVESAAPPTHQRSLDVNAHENELENAFFEQKLRNVWNTAGPEPLDSSGSPTGDEPGVVSSKGKGGASRADNSVFDRKLFEDELRRVYEGAGEKSPNVAEQSPHSTAEGHTSSNSGATPPAARGSKRSSAPEPDPEPHSQDGGTPVSDLGGGASAEGGKSSVHYDASNSDRKLDEQNSKYAGGGAPASDGVTPEQGTRNHGARSIVSDGRRSSDFFVKMITQNLAGQKTPVRGKTADRKSAPDDAAVARKEKGRGIRARKDALAGNENGYSSNYFVNFVLPNSEVPNTAGRDGAAPAVSRTSETDSSPPPPSLPAPKRGAALEQFNSTFTADGRSVVKFSRDCSARFKEALGTIKVDDFSDGGSKVTTGELQNLFSSVLPKSTRQVDVSSLSDDSLPNDEDTGAEEQDALTKAGTDSSKKDAMDEGGGGADVRGNAVSEGADGSAHNGLNKLDRIEQVPDEASRGLQELEKSVRQLLSSKDTGDGSTVADSHGVGKADDAEDVGHAGSRANTLEALSRERSKSDAGSRSESSTSSHPVSRRGSTGNAVNLPHHLNPRSERQREGEAFSLKMRLKSSNGARLEAWDSPGQTAPDGGALGGEKTGDVEFYEGNGEYPSLSGESPAFDLDAKTQSNARSNPVGSAHSINSDSNLFSSVGEDLGAETVPGSHANGSISDTSEESPRHASFSESSTQTEGGEGSASTAGTGFSSGSESGSSFPLPPDMSGHFEVLEYIVTEVQNISYENPEGARRYIELFLKRLRSGEIKSDNVEDKKEFEEALVEFWRTYGGKGTPSEREEKGSAVDTRICETGSERAVPPPAADRPQILEEKTEESEEDGKTIARRRSGGFSLHETDN